MKKVLFPIILTLLVSSCNPGEESSKVETVPGDTVAVVGGEVITDLVLKSQLPDIPGYLMNSKQREDLIHQLIKTLVFYKAAREEGLDTLPEVRAKLYWYRRSLLAQTYLSQKLLNLPVDEKFFTDYLEKNRDYLNKRVDILLVFFTDSTLIPSIKKDMRFVTYRNFDRKLKKYQADPDVTVSYNEDQNLGLIMLQIPDVLADQIKATPFGKATDVVKLNESYGIAKVLRVRNSKLMPEEKKILFETLKRVKREEMEDSLYRVLQSKYEIKIIRRNVR